MVLFLTFWFAYAIIYVGVDGISGLSQLTVGKRLRLSHDWRLILSGVFLILLFVQHLRTCPRYWTEVDFESHDPKRALMLRGYLGPAGALLGSPRVTAKIVTDLLMTGPRLMTTAWGLVLESRLVSRLDEAGCGQLLLILASRPTATPYDELTEAGWEAWFKQMRLIDGVVFLEKGISVNSDLKLELIEIMSGDRHEP